MKSLLTKQDNAIPSAQRIADYLGKEIQWSDRKRAPSKETCHQLISIGNMLQKAPRSRVVMSLAEVAWGRDTIFDEFSKLLMIVQKCSSVNEFEFVMEGLYTGMKRTDNVDRWSKTELSSKAGELNRWIFTYKYFMYLLKTYPFASESPSQQMLFDRVKNMMMNPGVWLDAYSSKVACPQVACSINAYRHIQLPRCC